MIGVVIMPTDAMPDELSFVRGAVGELSESLTERVLLGSWEMRDIILGW